MIFHLLKKGTCREKSRFTDEQIAFAPIKFRSVVENDTGIRRQVEMPKRAKPWWFVTDTGKLALSVRYGTKVLELAKGKMAVEVGTEKDLVPYWS